MSIIKSWNLTCDLCLLSNITKVFYFIKLGLRVQLVWLEFLIRNIFMWINFKIYQLRVFLLNIKKQLVWNIILYNKSNNRNISKKLIKKIKLFLIYKNRFLNYKIDYQKKFMIFHNWKINLILNLKSFRMKFKSK